MNDLQCAVLEIFKNYIAVCNSLHLRYYLVCGSALGAVKYGGFIPWDDDLDVGMPREDYEVFLAKGSDYLPKHLFLQNYRTDKNFPHVYSKLRNSDTTLIESGVAHLEMNHGIFIDIFPLDGYPSEMCDAKRLVRRKRVLSWKQYCALNDRSKLKIRVRNKIFRMLGYHKRTQRTLQQIDELISGWSTDASEILCNHGNWQGQKEIAPKWHYGKGTKCTFEGVDVIIPEKYDDYLTQKYGDWRNDPPKDKQKAHHDILVLDTQKPYTDYILL